jgi:proline iminopeptidase
MQKDPVSWLWPVITSFREGALKVSELHTIYWYESGNPQGVPVCVLHGGPGAGSSEKVRQFFDPRTYRIVQFDQRGSGKSVPFSCIIDNTTQLLVEDTEKLRKFLNIPKWHIFGGSWGSTLALAYSQAHPKRCLSLSLRGIFALRKCEIDWFYQSGASFLFPEAWSKYVSHIPEAERGDLVFAYHKRLTSSDEAVRLAAAKVCCLVFCLVSLLAWLQFHLRVVV